MIDKAYKDWLIGLKGTIRSAQIKAAVTVNTELITLYWDLGKMITEKQTAWGTGFLEQLSKDLKEEFPVMQGFSRRNLSNTVNFYQFYSASIWQQPVAQLPKSNKDRKSQQPVDQLQTSSELIPEYAGKLNFYLSAVDSLVKQEDDKPTIGIILCRDKNNIEAAFALRDINKPMGVSEFTFTEILPDELKSSMPTIEEIENELKYEQF